MSEKFELDQQALRRRLVNVTVGGKNRIRSGFTVLSRMDEAEFEKLVNFVCEKMILSESFTPKQALEITSLSPETVIDVLNALSFTGATFADLSVQASEFVSFAPDDLILPEDRPIAQRVAEYFMEAGNRLKEGRLKSKLISSVLPLFQHLDIEIDLRVSFDEGGAVQRTVPVAVAHIGTDNENDAFFVQFGLTNLEHFIEQLREVHGSMLRLSRMRLSDD